MKTKIESIRGLAERGEEILTNAVQKLDNINEAVSTLEEAIEPYKLAIEQFDAMDDDLVRTAIETLEGEGVS